MSGALFLSTAEVAELLALPPTTLSYWNWAHTAPAGFPVPIRVGGRLRYSKVALDAWIATQIEAAEAGARGG